MTLNLDHLKQIAQAATEGDWLYLPAATQNEAGDYSPPEIISWAGATRHTVDHGADFEHMAAFDPPTALALITRIEQAEHRVRRYKALAETRLETIQRVRDARANHPEIPACDRYTDDDTIKCGWRSAIESIDKALEGDPNA